jgi:hypothetical protein
MKTYIIQLEQHDDLISVRDKMSWAKSPRILLVWPSRRKVNIRPLDLVLLKRHASALGSQLGIVSKSGEIRRSASDSEIPVFKTPAEAQKEIWKIEPILRTEVRKRIDPSDLRDMKEELKTSEPAGVKSPSARIWIFSAGVLAVLVFFIILLPSATIQITPITQPQNITIPIVVDPSATDVNISGIVPAYPISTTVEGKDELPATGKMTVPEGRASGVVRFTNLTQTKVLIPEGTIINIISDPSIRFSVTQAGEVPEGVGESIDIPVRALLEGYAGNLPADSLKLIEGSLGLYLSVTNPDPTTGGMDAEKTSPTDADRHKLYKQAEELLSVQAMAEIEAQVPPGGFLIADSLHAEKESIDFDPPLGEPGANLSLDLIQTYQAYYISAEDLIKLGTLVLDSTLPGGYSPLAGSMVATPSGTPTVGDGGEIAWELTAERLITKDIDDMTIITKVLGKTPNSAIKNLSEIKMVGSPKINISPPWWLLMPSIPMRITVEMEK